MLQLLFFMSEIDNIPNDTWTFLLSKGWGSLGMRERRTEELTPSAATRRLVFSVAPSENFTVLVEESNEENLQPHWTGDALARRADRRDERDAWKLCFGWRVSLGLGERPQRRE